jgi:hypothetical protein
MSFHPWRQLREHGETELGWQDSDTHLGHYDFTCDRVVITTGMSQAERRSTLTHELIHKERGPVAPGCESAEERVVDDLAARRLITLEDLIDGMVWCYGEHELAEHLWVDHATLVTRLRNLSAAESRFINDELDRREMTFP